MSYFNKLQTTKLLETEEDIKCFESTIQVITSLKDITAIEDLYLVLDDNTEHHEVMFSVIHSIEYLYADKEVEGLHYLTLAIPKMLENAEDWLEIIHFRILNNPITRASYAKTLQSTKKDTKEIVIRLLTKIKNEDEKLFGSKVSEILGVLGG